jgi:hypothetical protein
MREAAMENGAAGDFPRTFKPTVSTSMKVPKNSLMSWEFTSTSALPPNSTGLTALKNASVNS